MTSPQDHRSAEELAARLDELEQTMAAIQAGEVDGLVVLVDGMPRVFTLEGTDAFHRALVEQMPEGAAAVNADGRVLYANSCLASMLGVPLEQVIGAELVSFVQPFQRTVLNDLLAAGTSAAATDLQFVRPRGSLRSVAVSVSPVDGSGAGTRCVVCVDLSDRERAEAALREAEGRFRGAFDGAPTGMALLDLDGRIREANVALATMAGTPSEALIGSHLSWVVGTEDIDSVLYELRSGARTDARLDRRSAVVGGERIWLGVQVTVLRDDLGHATSFLAQVHDESERRRHEQQLLHLASHDELTGLLNRRGFEALLDEHLARDGDLGTGALLLLDVDHFKYVNDTRGHHVGDEVLRHLADAMRGRMRRSDAVARLGGDEFAVLLVDGGPDDALHIAHDLLAAARSLDPAAIGVNESPTVSIGVVVLDDATRTASELMALADVAMYDSKEAGRDRVTLHRVGPARTDTGSGLSWLRRIEQAIAGEELLLDAQPIVDLASGRTVRHELLVRLPGPGDERVVAAEWFSVAERYGLAPAIDEWVAERSLALLAAGSFDALSVNVSATTIGRTSWRDGVLRGLARAGVDPSRLTFEITETAAIGNIAAAARFTEQLRTSGCRLALDDFGAGFGSFYYLKHLPFDDVKIDGEFVRSCAQDERDRAIIRSMVDVTSSMGRRTVAECTEDAETLTVLRAHGVDMGQGYHLGAPQPVDLDRLPPVVSEPAATTSAVRPNR